MKTTAIYPGSFDPVTRGHEDIIRRSTRFADQVIVAVTAKSAKSFLFSLEERIALLNTVTDDMPSIEVRAFDGLLANFAKTIGASIIVRGLRAVSDFEYELQMALMNRELSPELETIFLVPDPHLTFLSSSLVREVASLGGDVSALVHPAVDRELRARFQ